MLQSQSGEHASDSLIKYSCVISMMYSRNGEQASPTDRTRWYISVDHHCIEHEYRVGLLQKRHTRYHATQYHNNILIFIPAHIEILNYMASGE